MKILGYTTTHILPGNLNSVPLEIEIMEPLLGCFWNIIKYPLCLSKSIWLMMIADENDVENSNSSERVYTLFVTVSTT